MPWFDWKGMSDQAASDVMQKRGMTSEDAKKEDEYQDELKKEAQGRGNAQYGLGRDRSKDKK